MRRWPVRSALYIDFENVPLPPESIANWLAWLEDGIFDTAGRRRRFLQKRVYWNSHAERHRDLFERHGFAPILIGKFSGLKNGADIRMAMDIVETTYTRFEIDEFILLTGDSDFVPVLDRLREKGKRSAIVATEHRPNIHTTYQLHADVLIPSRRLTSEAASYKRLRRGLLARLLMRSKSGAPANPDQTAQKGANAKVLPQPTKPPPIKPGVLPGTPMPSPTEPREALEAAVERCIDLLSQQPRNYMAQRRVLAELDKVPGFRRQGAGAYLGYGSYRTFMRELAKLDARIAVVEQPGGGTGVVFIPAASPPLVAEPPSPAGPKSTTAPALKPMNGSSTAPKPASSPPALPPAIVPSAALQPPLRITSPPPPPEPPAQHPAPAPATGPET